MNFEGCLVAAARRTAAESLQWRLTHRSVEADQSALHCACFNGSVSPHPSSLGFERVEPAIDFTRRHYAYPDGFATSYFVYDGFSRFTGGELAIDFTGRHCDGYAFAYAASAGFDPFEGATLSAG